MINISSKNLIKNLDRCMIKILTCKGNISVSVRMSVSLILETLKNQMIPLIAPSNKGEGSLLLLAVFSVFFSEVQNSLLLTPR
jgi:acetaldehyde dehydrogenase (acetylating)